jgi:sugar phosphate isomerase/epimerase
MMISMNRRQLLGTIGTTIGTALGAAATSATLRSQSTTPASNAPIKLGVATYSLREFQRDLAIHRIQEMGIAYADVKEVHLPQNDSPAQLAAGRHAFDKAGIDVIAGGNITLSEPDEAGLRPHFEYARLCKFPIMVCAPHRDNLALVEKLAIEFDVKIAIHNHGPEDKQFPTPRSVLEAVKNMDPRMGLCIDIGHTARTGEDIVESVRLAGPRLYEMHFKDLRDKTKESQCIVGQGMLPIPAIFRELRKIGYTGVCSLEYEIEGDDPVPGMQQSFAYMRGVIAGQNS